MNKQDVLDFLIQLLGSIRLAPEFISELVSLIAKSGYEGDVLRILAQRILFLNQEGKFAVRGKEFEQIDESIFSLHMTGKGFNLRVLFAFLPSDEPVFLYPFFERAGKRATDYTRKIPIAKERFEKEKETYEQEQAGS